MQQTKNRQNKRKLGECYEELAAGYLIEKGYIILQKNYRNIFGEIDILARQGDYLVFVEVKYRSSKAYGDPAEAVGIYKQRRISKAALGYIFSRGYSYDMPCRFDVIAVYQNGVIRHIPDAFEFSY